MRDTICVEVDGVEYESAKLKVRKIRDEGMNVDTTEYVARLEDFPECFGTGRHVREVRRSFRGAIKRQLSNSGELAAQKLVIKVGSLSPVRRKTIGVRAKKNGNTFAGRVPAGAEIIIMPANDLPESSSVQKPIPDVWNIDNIRRVIDHALSVILARVSSLMKIVELRQEIGNAVIEVVVRPWYQKGEEQILTTDVDGNLDAYVYVATRRDLRLPH